MVVMWSPDTRGHAQDRAYNVCAHVEVGCGFAVGECHKQLGPDADRGVGKSAAFDLIVISLLFHADYLTMPN